MALTLTIGGANYLPQYVNGTAQIRERLANQSNELRLQITKKAAQSAPTQGAEIIFMDGARTLFAGYVTKAEPTEVGKGQLITYRVEATDYTYILLNKVAAEAYTNKTLAYIVNDLLTNYVDAGYGITQTNVATGPTIATISFNYISLRKAFEKLSQVTGYKWWIDYDKDVHFVSSTAVAAPESFKDSTTNYESVTISADTSQLRNSVVVRGGREETSSSISEEFLGDATARAWILKEKPKTMVSIELDTGAGYVSKTYGVDPIDEEGSNYFMFNFQEKYVRCATGSATPGATHKIRVTYKYEVPVLVKVTSALSIAAMQAIEGGDGIHDYVIVRESLKSKAEARLVAVNDIAEHGNPMIKGVVVTRTGLLTAGSYFHPGQVVTINMPTWGISSDTQYLIQEVGISVLENTGSVEYTYVITFGGRLIGIREFLENLAGHEQVVLDNEDVDKIQAFEEIATISESITRNSNARTLSETVTTSESISRTNTTPPFKWAPSGTKKAVWGKFEWA